jgi:hypothetical protein
LDLREADLEPAALSSHLRKAPKITQKEKKFLFLYENTPLPAPPEVLPWSPQSVWDSVVAVLGITGPLRPESADVESFLLESTFSHRLSRDKSDEVGHLATLA